MKTNKIGMPVQNKQQKHQSMINFGYRLNMASEANIYPNTDKYFSQNVIKALRHYPHKYTSFLQNKGYQVIISNSINDVLYMNGINIPNAYLYENDFPKDTLGSTIKFNRNKNYIVFCDNRPYSTIFTENIVNNTLSSALAENLNLYQNKELLSLVTEDILDINYQGKLNRLNNQEQKLLVQELTDSFAQIKIREIIPDLIAWNIDKGKYGSGLYDVHNPYFLSNLFPKTNRWLKSFVSNTLN